MGMRARRSTWIYSSMLSAATPSARAPLAEFGYDVTDVTVDDLLTKKILIRQYCLQTDIHPFVRGAVFDGVWAKRVPGTIGETPVDFASLDDLITKKKAAGQLRSEEHTSELQSLRHLVC